MIDWWWEKKNEKKKSVRDKILFLRNYKIRALIPLFFVYLKLSFFKLSKQNQKRHCHYCSYCENSSADDDALASLVKHKILYPSIHHEMKSRMNPT